MKKELKTENTEMKQKKRRGAPRNKNTGERDYDLYVQVIIDRWEQLTGQKAIKLN